MNPVYIKEPLAQDAILISVRGRLDHDSVPDLEATLLELLEKGYINLVIDMKEATYINSSGLRVLVSILKASKQQGGDVFLSSLNKRLTDIFNMAGFNKVFSIWPTSDEAINALVS
jgi:anti-sigma B factor antagonist